MLLQIMLTSLEERFAMNLLPFNSFAGSFFRLALALLMVEVEKKNNGKIFKSVTGKKK